MKKIGIVLLAAGNSRRYNGIKLLDNVNGEIMYTHILKIAASLCAMPKIMVTQYQQIQKKALEYGFEAVINEEPDLGISHSIHLGLHKALEMEPDLDGVLFSVCDQPYLQKNTLERLLETYSHSEKAMASVSYEENLGNPCIIGSEYFKDLFALEGDVGGKRIICRYPEEVEPVTVDNEKELMDIDTKDDSWL